MEKVLHSRSLGAGEWKNHQVWQCRNSTVVKEFLIFPNRCKTMAQGVCDKVSSESLCTSSVKDKEIYGQGRSVISAWVWQFIFWDGKSVVFWVGNKYIMPVLGWSPWVELPGPYKRSLHHRAVIVMMAKGLLWSLWWAQLLRDRLGTWVVGFNLGVEVALIEAISALYGMKEVMRI